MLKGLEYAQAYTKYGSWNAVAKKFGKDRRGVQRQGERYLQDPAVQHSMDAVGTNLVPTLAWLKTKNEKGTSYSVLLRPAPQEEENFVEQVKAVFDSVKPAKIPAQPKQANKDLMSMYALMDAHFGMQAWGAETLDQNYSIKDATLDLQNSFSYVKTWTPDSENTLLLIGGDFFHADDNKAQTPQHHHNLDVDNRFFKVVDSGVEVIVSVINSLLEKHKKVTIRVMRGNHDEHAHIILMIGLSRHYRNTERVNVIMDPADLFMHRFHNNLISAHHGDRSNPQRLVNYISDVCPFWSDVYFRYVFTGHIHSDQSKDIGAIKWESLRAFCPSDAYAAGSKYRSRRSLQSVTFDKERGIVTRANDPIYTGAAANGN
jgi:hypothetical protein